MNTRYQGREALTWRSLDQRAFALAGVMVLGGVSGCKQDARLADAAIKPAVVVDVVDAGLSLDKNATADMVAYALLAAIKDDVEAAGDLKAREAAFDREFRLAAPSAIQKQHARFVGKAHADRDESVYKTVRGWAPTLAYYADNFNFTWDEAKNHMRTVSVPTRTKDNVAQVEEKHVLLEVRDPHDDPNASAVVRIRLVEEESRWRVWWVGFDHGRRRLASKAAAPAATSQPTG